ncbi:NACHT domain-containing protein [Extibacter muris]|uniref:NACHT domain-containing protein n=1 Tax=Extibacter muris TaxID=1796622 RepID=UPI001D074B0A|nr:hypothetical protein [Extibacter muris]MCB6200829.1 hypothetical protein [Extibacter muris]MCQ4662160.1 hypothetical protein [Extibacter muris]MCQ4691927.1 hypothetical protein [Extibacter muris]
MSEELNVNKITAEVISDLAKSASQTVLKKLTKSYKDMVKREEIDYGIAFENYLTDAEKSIRMAKTILYGQVPHDLYSFFECMGIHNKEKVVNTSDINNILKIGHKIIITGTGGIGKSMLMKHCFLDAIKNTQYIPVLVELRGLNECAIEDISIKNFIYKTLNIFGFKLEEEYFEYSLETGCYLILFDGYDEVKNAYSQKVTHEIIDFSNKYSGNHLIVSSRPLDEFVGWSDFIEYSSMKLSKVQALSLIEKLDYDEELKCKFYKQLDEELYDRYQSFASNPLLLTIMLMTFEERISIPDSRTDFYEQAFSTLFHRHDAMKRGKFKREIQSNLGYEDFKKVFSYYCFRTFFKNQYEFTEKSVLENIVKAKEKVYSFGNFSEIDYLNDLTNAVCMLVHEGLNYRFAHRSFQEYFAAVYATQLSDEEQKQFVTSWLKSMAGRLTTDFLDILCELQPDRFMKNILYDSMYELYNMYEANACSDEWFIEYMYESISIRDKGDRDYRVGVMIRESYFQRVFTSMLHYLHYPYNDNNQDEEYYQIVEKLESKYKTNKKGRRVSGITFEQLKEDGLYDEAIKTIKWVIERKDFAFDALEKIDINTFGRKRKFESMLDDL